MLHPRTPALGLATCLGLAVGLPAHSEVLKLSPAPTATCPTLYDFNAKDKSLCDFVGHAADASTCQPATLFTVTAAGRCEAKTDPLPAICPDIKGYKTHVKPDEAGVPTCTYERPDLPSNHAGDYLGDCFRLKTPLFGQAPGTRYIVTEQDSTNPDDPTLYLVHGFDWGLGIAQDFVPGWLSCRVTTSDAPPVKTTASELARSGATRRGYSFGLLTMPYKYYPGTKTFVGGLPIGGYLGWRAGQPGSSFTWAVAATLGSVQAQTFTTDATGKQTITGNTNAAALSWAIGATFDVNRSLTSKAFRSGIFVGKDHVNTTDNLRYDYNNKTWVAIQIGFDFTDY